MPIRPILLLLIAALLPVEAASQTGNPPSDVHALIESFSRAYESGDADALASLFAETMPVRHKIIMESTHRARCMTVRHRTIESWAPGGEGGQATLEWDVVLRDRAADFQRATLTHYVLDIVRVNGAPRIKTLIYGEEQLVKAVVEAPDDATAAAALQGKACHLNEVFAVAGADLLVNLVDRNMIDVSRRGLPRIRALTAGMGPYADAALTTVDSLFVRKDGKYGEAVQIAEESLRKARASGDADMIARTLNSVARALQYFTGNSRRSEPYFEEVLALTPRLVNQPAANRAAGLLAASLNERGSWNSALHYAAMAMRIAEQSNDRWGFFNTTTLLSNIHAEQGDCRAAIQHAREAIRWAEQLGFPTGVTGSWRDIANCAMQLGDDALFREAIDKAIASGKTLASAADRAGLLTGSYAHLARWHLQRREMAEADEALIAALEHDPQNPDAFVRASMTDTLAMLRERQGRLEEAVERATAAQAMRATAESTHNLDSWVIAASALRKLGRRDEAYARLRQAVSLAEAHRTRVTGHELQRSLYLRAHLTPFLDLIDMLVEDGKTAEAMEVAGRAKARALLDVLRSNRSEGEGDAQAPEPPAPPVRLEDAAARLPRGTVILEYAVTDRHLHVFRSSVRNGKLDVRVRTVPAVLPELAREIAQIAKRLASRDATYADYVRPLTARLLDAADERAAASAEIAVIIPDAVLWKLPFEALITRDGRHLGEKAALVYAPSLASWLQLLQTQSAAQQGGVLAVANPRIAQHPELPGTEQEARAVAARVSDDRAVVLTGGDATEERVRTHAYARHILHFATHASYDDVNPMYSHLLLAGDSAGAKSANDGRLEAWEILRMPLSADLAVLSACETGRGEVHRGEGLIGLSWAFLAAGCDTVLVSHWRVDNAATKELMVRFYDRWRSADPKTPFAKVTALRDARRALARDARFAHPYYWAPFVLIGAGR
jgi:tetratricopeptide (TPR) repeat protein